jgi:large subunit ribosomal protein L3e
MAYKAGMTHIVRDVDRPGSKLNKKEVVEPVSIIEAPPMYVVGLTGYQETPQGLKCIGTVWTQHLSEECRRRFYRNWYRAKKQAFNKYTAAYATADGKKKFTETVDKISTEASVVRVIAHTQLSKMKHKSIRTRKAHIMEIQVNGGKVADKIKFAKSLLETEIRVDSVFQPSEACDILAVTTGHGFEGVVQRWGVTKLPRKTHRGLRKVACIGAWHPARVRFTVARPGQDGFHHRTELNKKIYKIGKNVAEEPHSGKTEYDVTEKSINPMGGYVSYGEVKQDFLIIKGSVPGPLKRVLTLRRPMTPQASRMLQEKITLKFIDTSSKIGHGRFQTSKEKYNFMGPLKKHRKTEEETA